MSWYKVYSLLESELLTSYFHVLFFLVLAFSVGSQQTGTRSGNEQIMKPIIMVNKAIQLVKG
jgi:hypothetical protein